MNLPELNSDTVQATLERLANGEECPECCNGKIAIGKRMAGSKWQAAKTCPTCKGIGKTEPDLRMIDALVHREVAIQEGKDIKVHKVSLPGYKVEYLPFDEYWQDCKSTPRYTTDWGAGGPLLEEACRSSGAMIVHTQQLPYSTRIDIEHPDWDEPLTVWNDESELITRVCAWLIWKVRTGAEA